LSRWHRLIGHRLRQLAVSGAEIFAWPEAVVGGWGHAGF
jgi:hypothetical protein